MPRLNIYVDCSDQRDLERLRDAIIFEVDVVIDSIDEDFKGKVEMSWDTEDEDA